MKVLKPQVLKIARPQATYADQGAFNALLRNNLVAFTEKAFDILNGGENYLPNWHVPAVCNVLLGTLKHPDEGGVLKQAIFLPPRHLKSITASIAFVGWALGHNPKLRFIVVSHSQDLAVKLHRDFRQIMMNEVYFGAFPHMRQEPRTNTESEYETAEGGGRLAISIGSSITGRGGDFIIIDDPAKAELAENEADQMRIRTYFNQTLSTRLNNKKTGRTILVMQRLSINDLGTVALENSNWRVLKLPAIAEKDETIALGGGETYTRKKGEPLHPEHEDLAVFDDLKKQLGSVGFSAQYQQEPIPRNGGLLPLEWFQRYELLPPADTDEMWLHSWDCASSLEEGASFSVFQLWLVNAGKMYLVDQVRRRMLFAELEKVALEKIKAFPPKHLIIERESTGEVLAQRMWNHFPYAERRDKVIGLKPRLSKEDRANACAAFIESGRVLLPAPDSQLSFMLKTLEPEIRAFPNGSYDDQVDAMTLAVNYYQRAYVHAYKPKAYLIGGGRSL